MVFARMDSNGAGQEVYQAHPEWFTRDAEGKALTRDQDLYAPCINVAYYREHIPADPARGRARGTIGRRAADNARSGLLRASICYCASCRARSATSAATTYPSRGWNAPASPRLDRVELRLPARDLGPPTTRPRARRRSGVLGGRHDRRHARRRRQRLSRLSEICRRADGHAADHQRRDETSGFAGNGQTGKSCTACWAGTAGAGEHGALPDGRE